MIIILNIIALYIKSYKNQKTIQKQYRSRTEFLPETLFAFSIEMWRNFESKYDQ